MIILWGGVLRATDLPQTSLLMLAFGPLWELSAIRLPNEPLFNVLDPLLHGDYHKLYIFACIFHSIRAGF